KHRQKKHRRKKHQRKKHQRRRRRNRMTLPLYCLLGYVGWTMLLLLAIVSVRGLAVFTGKKRVNEFPGGVPHGGDAYWRLYRAHANVVENLPIVASVILVGTLLHVATPAFERLPAIALGARV